MFTVSIPRSDIDRITYNQIQTTLIYELSLNDQVSEKFAFL